MMQSKMNCTAPPRSEEPAHSKLTALHLAGDDEISEASTRSQAIL